MRAGSRRCWRPSTRPGAPALRPEAVPELGDLIATLPVAMLLVDPRGRVVQANAEAELLLNLSERAMLGQQLTQILTPPPGSDRGRTLAAFDVEAGRTGTALRVDYLQTYLSGPPGWRSVVLHARGAARRPGHVPERPGGARAAIGAAAMLAHEIKNPLSGIRGAAQLLAGGAERGELTRLITTEVDRIAALIDRMQDFTDTRPLDLGPENIYPLLDHVRGVAQAGFARGVAIEERFDPSLPAVLADRDALVQILLNLLKNAAEATAGLPHARILLTTAYRHGFAVSAGEGRPKRPLPIEISVRDTGPGAPVDIADQLFDPFVSGKPGGQGLGLALVAKLVADMGGVVQYAREGSPVMTVFRLLLPRAP